MWRDLPNTSCVGCRRPRAVGRKRCCRTSRNCGKVPTNWCSTTTSCSEKSCWKITKPWKNDLAVYDNCVIIRFELFYLFFFHTHYVLMTLCLFELKKYIFIIHVIWRKRITTSSFRQETITENDIHACYLNRSTRKSSSKIYSVSLHSFVH